MTSEKRLLRSRKALIGGVCAGVADYFNVDPVIVRIIMVVFTLASGGLLGIAYILLWIVLPLEPKEEAPLDVHPQSVHSETYGTFEFGDTPPSFIGAKIILQPFQHAHVQMVCRFIKKKEIRMTHESSRQINPDLLTAGKRMNIPIPVLFRKTETR